MKICCVSDTHTYYDYKDVPDADVLVHAGDLSVWGKIEELQPELLKISALPHKYKIVIAGNHDFLAEKDLGLFLSLKPSNIIYLQDSEVTIGMVKFYGMPWVPGLPRWAFSNRRCDWPGKLSNIPNDVDVLVTHAPSYMVRDGVVDRFTSEVHHYGSHKLLDRVEQLKPKAHIFGHIHDSHGWSTIMGTQRVNAAICDEDYRPSNKPILIEV